MKEGTTPIFTRYRDTLVVSQNTYTYCIEHSHAYLSLSATNTLFWTLVTKVWFKSYLFARKCKELINIAKSGMLQCRNTMFPVAPIFPRIRIQQTSIRKYSYVSFLIHQCRWNWGFQRCTLGLRSKIRTLNVASLNGTYKCHGPPKFSTPLIRGFFFMHLFLKR